MYFRGREYGGFGIHSLFLLVIIAGFCDVNLLPGDLGLVGNFSWRSWGIDQRFFFQYRAERDCFLEIWSFIVLGSTLLELNASQSPILLLLLGYHQLKHISNQALST